ncbi:hypothetical protein K6Y31_21040 [Motilimonas cestriensis]|uniref:Uncharacterized protein n=1 Tax=Motilimonas cestriensis TaxID=2742685 RepID=A0ABS8WDZ1_9GAMM|nr:hypothetical protein [Motilimonas cestriensis]MCE2597264.1 hypothetical protein [Motilimonas cestriensis]
MAKLTSRNSVNMTPQVVEKKFSPQLLIPFEATQSGERHHHFPEYDAIMARYGVDDVRIVRKLEKAISTAQRVWIIDKHLFSEDGKNPSHGRRIKKVVNWSLTNHIQTIRILTGHHDNQAEIEKEFKELEDFVTDDRAKVDAPLKVEISFAFKDFDYIHDRFAIIDEEL